VTHAVDFLPKADHIILMDEGRVVAQGTYNEMEDIKEFKEIMDINDLNKNLDEKSDKDSAEGDTETDNEE
jgi:ABC-type multidrug transport system ATPase subunit